MSERDLINEFVGKINRHKIIAKMMGNAEFNPQINNADSLDTLINELSKLSFSEINQLRDSMIGHTPLEQDKK